MPLFPFPAEPPLKDVTNDIQTPGIARKTTAVPFTYERVNGWICRYLILYARVKLGVNIQYAVVVNYSPAICRYNMLLPCSQEGKQREL